MHHILQFAETAYIETQNLMPLLSDYTNPSDFISRMVKRGELIRLKNGFFVIAEKIEKSPVPYEQIANLLYGPSYLSFEWALSYYGMIPEGVYVVTSAAATRSKNYLTPIGVFEYTFLGHSRYAVGIDQKENSSGKFLIATPEKALADIVHKKSKNLTSKDLLVDLVEGRRIDEAHLRNLDKRHLSEIAECYHSQTVNNLLNIMGLL
jgi:predicted transcriptional regulator of viral defense system